MSAMRRVDMSVRAVITVFEGDDERKLRWGVRGWWDEGGSWVGCVWRWGEGGSA